MTPFDVTICADCLYKNPIKLMKKTDNKRNKIIRIRALLTTLVCTLIMGQSAVFAVPSPSAEELPNTEATSGVERGAFEVTKYELRATVSKDHSYDVTELISVNIPEQVQSMEFAIPSGNFRISDMEVENAAYASSKGADASTVKIVDPEKLSPGIHQYTIKYKIREFEDTDSTQDMFYFNVLLPEWKQPIGEVDIKVDFPEDFPWDDMQCYAGQFGVQDVNNRVEFKSYAASKTVSVKGEKIPENFGITLKAELPDGYWNGALNGSWVRIAILNIMGLMLIALSLMWLIGGRDPKIERTNETKPFDDIRPSDVGYIFDGETGIRDILMLIIDFARKGYLAISEYEPKRYRIIRKEEPVNEEKFCRNAYSILFEDVFKNRGIDMEELGDRLMRVRDAIRDDIAAGYGEVGSVSFTTLSRVFRLIGIVLAGTGVGVSNALTYRYQYLGINYIESITLGLIFAVVSYILAITIDRRDSTTLENNRLLEFFSVGVLMADAAYVAHGIASRAGSIVVATLFIIGCVFAVIFIIIMRARGRENAELAMRLRRLRQFINHPTPKELLENHLADENYYYKMLEYALAMGAEESWAISFLTLNVPEPKWYSDDIEGHAYSNLREETTTLDYARDLRTFLRTIETAFHELERRKHRR